jgi:hypothetical protein
VKEKPLVKKTYTIEEMKKAGLLKRASSIQKDGRGERAKAKKKAWVQFSLFIRLRDSDENGIATCITCGRRKSWRQMQAGHYVTRAKETTLFNEKNSHSQCAGCNMFQGGKPLEYEVEMDKRYGAGAAQSMRDLGRMESKRTIADYQRIETYYKEIVTIIRLNSPNKFKAE